MATLFWISHLELLEPVPRIRGFTRQQKCEPHSRVERGRSYGIPRRHADRAERLRSLVDRLSPADRARLLSTAGVLDQIVQLANEQDEDLMKGAGSERKRECTVADDDRR